MATRNVEWLDTSLLDINEGQMEGLPKNPRSWTKDELNKLKKSLQETPELFEARPILAYDYDGRLLVLGGNMRLSAAKALGMAKVPVYVYPSSTPLEKLKEIVIKDNGAFGAWDWDMLANEWDALPLSEWGVPTWKVDEEEEHEQATAQEDDFDEEKDEIHVVCQRGDIWQLGEHRLMCGDSTKAENVARLMNGEQADLWLTDPPYNVDYTAAKNRTSIVSGAGGIHHEDIKNDTMSDEDYLDFLVKAFGAAASVMRAGCAYYIWYASTYHSTVEKAILEAGLLVKQQLIWNKNTMVLGWYDYKYKHEPCLYGWKEGAHYFVNAHNRTTVWEDGEEIDIDKLKKAEMQKLLHDILDNRTPTTVINEKKPAKSEEHPTMKPVRLFGYQIANSSRPGNIILDTFGGSGTTIVACEQLGRKARLVELDPHYCDVIIARWEKFTGAKAVKL